MEMNPANTPDTAEGPETPGETYVPPTDSNELKFIKLAKSMKRLSPETIACIEDDLQPEEAEKAEDAKEGEGEDTSVSVSLDKPSSDTQDPRALIIMGLKKVLGFPSPKN